ncbi:MAG: hypothetical protein LBU11_10625 [Zoogloeaceae bacterium]|jgi:hypothetical protein|nr:hypothetical protein [Zoogloeaceae bacterium]
MTRRGFLRRHPARLIAWGAIQSGGKPCQGKRERKPHALTLKPVKSEGVSAAAIQTAFLLVLPFQKTEPPPGLPRRCAPRF